PSSILSGAASKIACMELLGDRIKQRRVALQLSQQQLADAVGVSRAAVSQWERGSTKGLRPANLIAVSKTLKCDVEWLVTGQHAPAPATDYARAYKTIDADVLASVFDVIDELTHNRPRTNQQLADMTAYGYTEVMRGLVNDSRE